MHPVPPQRTKQPKRKRVLDVAVIVVIYSYNFPIVFSAQQSTQSTPLIVIVFAGVCLPFLLRHQFPLAAFLVTLAFITVHFLLNIPFAVADIILVLCLCSLTTQLRWQLTVLPLLATLAWTVIATHQPFSAGYLSIGEIGFIIAIILLSYSWALTLKLYKQHITNLKLRAVELQRAQESRELIAKAEERRRIARELHDVVSHSLSSVVALSEGATATIDSDPEKARKAIQLIGKTGRDALGEMRAMLALLRTSDELESAPQPGVKDLEELLANARSTNKNISYRHSGNLATLNAGMQLTLYRIVQEALTNVRKHAAAHATVTIVVDRTPTMLQVIITNATVKSPATSNQTGYGLSGMRERVEAHGGSMKAGLLATGNFQIKISIPVKESCYDHQAYAR